MTIYKSFADTAIHAFPFSYHSMAADAVNHLAESISPTYTSPTTRVVVNGANVQIPQRIHFLQTSDTSWLTEGTSLAIRCLATRSTDGYIRQHALRLILNTNEPWAIPYVVLLLGEYVVEIAEDIQNAMPLFDRAAYVNFVLENRPLMRMLKARATSYWDCYYRSTYPKREAYPGLAALHHLECWAS